MSFGMAELAVNSTKFPYDILPRLSKLYQQYLDKEITLRQAKELSAEALQTEDRTDYISNQKRQQSCNLLGWCGCNVIGFCLDI